MAGGERLAHAAGARREFGHSVPAGAGAPAGWTVSGGGESESGLFAPAAGGRAAAHFSHQCGIAEFRGAAGRLGSARLRIARTFYRTFSFGMRARLRGYGRSGAEGERRSGGGGACEMPAGARERLPERVSRGFFRPLARREAGVGAFLHAAQNHGGKSGHAHVLRIGAGAG